LIGIEFRPNGGLELRSVEGAVLYFWSDTHDVSYIYTGDTQIAVLTAIGIAWTPVVEDRGRQPVLLEFDSNSPAARYRIPVPADGSLRPVLGDTVVCGEHGFSVGRVTWKLSPGYSYAEIDDGSAA
jgi:hypothetical protein